MKERERQHKKRNLGDRDIEKPKIRKIRNKREQQITN